MKWMERIVSVIFVLAVAFGGYRWMAAVDERISAQEQKIQEANAQVAMVYQGKFQEVYHLCDEYNLGCAPMPLELNDHLGRLTLAEIKRKYPSPDWRIEEKGNELTIYKINEGLCKIHREIYHLGVNSGGEFLTVCYGPSQVGSNGGIFLSTDIPLANLDIELQQKILQGEYQTNSVEELQGLLDSFSESQSF